MQQVKVCVGRFQPFHKGHLKMATYKDLKGPDTEQKESLREQPDLKEIAKQKTVIFVIYIDDAKVDDKHPFTHTDMEKEMNFVKKNYKDDIEDILFVKSADICAWGEMLKEKGYQASVWLTGSDEFKQYKYMAVRVPQYEEKNRDNRDFKDACSKSFYVEEIERTDNADFVSSISGTKVRQALFDDDKEYFKKAMPKGCDSLFDEFKEKLLKAPKAPEKKTKKKVKEGMRSLRKFLFESMDKYFSKKEIETIINDIKDKDGKFVKFVDDKVDKKLGWVAAYDDYFNQCLDDDRCTAELASYINELIRRDNFSIEQVQKLVNDELLNIF